MGGYYLTNKRRYRNKLFGHFCHPHVLLNDIEAIWSISDRAGRNYEIMI